MKVAVIGSGPAGLSSAKALVRRGVTPTVIDVGETLCKDRQAIVDRMAALEPTEWDRADVEAITKNHTFGKASLPQKVVFGSSFHFARKRSYAPDVTGEGPSRTFARGGYSVAWGAAILPAHYEDLEGWPVCKAALDASYVNVLEGISVSGSLDALETQFPQFTTDINPLPLPLESQRLLQDLLPRTTLDADASFLCGQARLAVDAGACKQCGLCLSGCIYGAIHSFGPQVERMHREGVIQYQPNRHVKRLEEVEDGVRVVMCDTHSRNELIESFDYVFLAAGAIESTRIVLVSLGLYDMQVAMKTSQKFALPLFSWQRTPMTWPNAPALASLFVDYKVPELSSRWIHAQLSAPNDYVLRALGVNPWQTGMRRRLMAPIIERLHVMFGGLHSDHSPEITLSLEDRGGEYGLNMQAEIGSESISAVRQAARRFSRVALLSRIFAPGWAMRIGSVGGGNHFGSTMPMREKPSARLDTDALGRVVGWERVHIVDGSVLSSIPATTLALLQMANADRIAGAAPLYG